jgi:hypothetical protein
MRLKGREGRRTTKAFYLKAMVQRAICSTEGQNVTYKQTKVTLIYPAKTMR